MILGHAHPIIEEAIKEALSKFTFFWGSYRPRGGDGRVDLLDNAFH